MNAEQLLERNKTDLDALYAQGAVHQIPTGASQGLAAFFPNMPLLNKAVSQVAKAFWTGKVFSSDGTSLKNKVFFTTMQSFKAEVYRGPSWYDGKESIIIDYSKTSFACQRVRDEMREIEPGLFLGRAYIRKQAAGKESTTELQKNGVLAVYFILNFNKAGNA